jgi:hypothetical protein
MAKNLKEIVRSCIRLLINMQDMGLNPLRDRYRGGGWGVEGVLTERGNPSKNLQYSICTVYWDRLGEV